MATTATQILRLLAQADVGDLKKAASALDDVDAKADKASKSGGRLGDALSGAGKVAAGVAAGGVAAVGAALFESARRAADFQQSLANVGSVTGASKDELAELRKEALAVGRDTSKSASEAAEAFGELLKAGMSVTDVVGGAGRTVVQLAEATGTSVSDMATLLSNSLNTFGLGADQSASVANTLARAANASAIDVADLGQSLQAVGPVASQAGLSMDDFATAMGILGNNALKGSDAGTSLKTMLLALTAPTDKAKALMEAYGVSVFDAEGKTRPFRSILGDLQKAMGDMSEEGRAAFAKDIFGTDAIRAANILVGEGVEGWDKFGAAMAQAPTVAEMSAARLDTLQGRLEQLKGSLETGAILIGEKLLPALTWTVEQVSVLVEKAMAVNWGELFAPLVAAVQEKVGPIFDQVRAAAEQVVSWFQTSWPTIRTVITTVFDGYREYYSTLFQGVITVATAVVEYFQSRWPAIKETLTGVFNDVKPVVERVVADIQTAFDTVVSFVKEKWPAIRDTAIEIFDAVGAALKGVMEEIGPTLDSIVSIVERIVGEIGERWGQIEGVVIPVITFVVDTVKNVLDTLSNAIQLVMNIIQGDWSEAWQNVKNIVGNLWEQIRSVVQLGIDAIPAILSLGLGLVKDAAQLGWDAVKKVAGDVWDATKKLVGEKIDELVELVKTLPTKITDGLGSLGNLLFDAGRDIVSGLWRGIVSLSGWIVSQITAWVKDVIPGPVRRALGIDSPSKVMAKQVGEPIVDGIIKGIKDRGPALKEELARVVKEAVDGATEAVKEAMAGPGSPWAALAGQGDIQWTSPETGWLFRDGRWYQIVSQAMQDAARAAGDLATSADAAAAGLAATATVAAIAGAAAAGLIAAAPQTTTMSGNGTDITTTMNYRGLQGIVKETVKDEYGTFVGYSVPGWLLDNYGGNYEALIAELEAGKLDKDAYEKWLEEWRKANPDKHAGGGFIANYTGLIDMATGRLYGTMSEPGTGGEWIVNQRQMQRIMQMLGAGTLPLNGPILPTDEDMAADLARRFPNMNAADIAAYLQNYGQRGRNRAAPNKTPLDAAMAAIWGGSATGGLGGLLNGGVAALMSGAAGGGAGGGGSLVLQVDGRTFAEAMAPWNDLAAGKSVEMRMVG